MRCKVGLLLVVLKTGDPVRIGLQHLKVPRTLFTERDDFGHALHLFAAKVGAPLLSFSQPQIQKLNILTGLIIKL